VERTPQHSLFDFPFRQADVSMATAVAKREDHPVKIDEYQLVVADFHRSRGPNGDIGIVACVDPILHNDSFAREKLNGEG
jgi:hypothetical protein